MNIRLTVAATLAAFALALIGCGDAPKPDAPLAKAGSSSPAASAALKKALGRVGEIKSGTIDFAVESAGKYPMRIAGGGPFDVDDAKNPEYVFELSVKAVGPQHKLAITRVGSKRYIGIDGAFVDLAKQPAALRSQSDALDPGQLKVYAEAFAGHLKNVRESAKRTVDGVPCTVYAATLDLAAAVATAQKLTGRTVGQLPLAGLEQLGDPNQFKGKASALTLAIDDDGMIREGTLDTEMLAINGERELKFRLAVDDLNEKVTVKLPRAAGRDAGTPSQLGITGKERK